MSEEQPIFVSSEDDVADVRERLAKITSRQVTLVIPSQTRLHSPVAWKLLHKDARQLGKDILIVSSDPQVRSVAQSAKFRVAHSLESSSSGRATPGSRPSRTGQAARGGRGTASPQGRGQLRSSTARRNVEQGSLGPRSQASGQISRSTQSSQSTQASQAGSYKESPEWYDPLSERSRPRREPESERPAANEAVTGGLSLPPSSTFEVFESNEPIYGQPYEFRIEPSLPIHPLPAESIDEPNLLMEDFNQAQNIRQAALEGSSEKPPATPGGKQGTGGATYRPTPLPREADDPFTYMEDAQPSPSPEQHGSVSIEGFDTTEHTMRDVSDFPTNILENDIEYEGDLGDFVERERRPPLTRPWDELPPEEEEPRVYGRRARSTRSGRISPPSEEVRIVDSRPPDDEAARRTASQQPQQQRPQQPLVMPTTANTRGAGPATAPAGLASRSGKPPAPQSRVGAGAPRTAPGRPAQGQRSQRPVPARTAPRPARERRRRRGGGIWIAVAILLVLIAGALAYFGPSADITITLPPSYYTHDISLTASTGAAARQSNGTQTMPATVLTSSAFTVSKDDLAATGSRAVGNTVATGEVVFTNTVATSGPITIPTGTLLQTTGNNPVQFVTTAESIVPRAAGASSPVIPINAVQKGTSGNVAANSITVIAPEGLQTIEQRNNTIDPALLKQLNVTNPDKTAAGGTETQQFVTDSDLQAATKALQGLLQSKVDAWQAPVGRGDVVGKPYITSMSQIDGPKAGTDVKDTTFSAKLSGKAAVLVVSQAALQDAARSQLSALMSKDAKYSHFMIYTDANNPVKLAKPNLLSGNNNTTLLMTFSATCTVLPNLTADQVQNMVVSKSKADAYDTLTSRKNIPDVQHVFITINPAFVNWMPFWTAHINVHIKPEPAPSGVPGRS